MEHRGPLVNQWDRPQAPVMYEVEEESITPQQWKEICRRFDEAVLARQPTRLNRSNDPESTPKGPFCPPTVSSRYGYRRWSNSSIKSLVSCHRYFQHSVKRHQHLYSSEDVLEINSHPLPSPDTALLLLYRPSFPSHHFRRRLIKSQQLLPPAQFLLQ